MLAKSLFIALLSLDCCECPDFGTLTYCPSRDINHRQTSKSAFTGDLEMPKYIKKITLNDVTESIVMEQVDQKIWISTFDQNNVLTYRVQLGTMGQALQELPNRENFVLERLNHAQRLEAELKTAMSALTDFHLEPDVSNIVFNKATRVAIRLFFSIDGLEDELEVYAALENAFNGDEEITDFLSDKGFDVSVWEPFEGNNVNFFFENVSSLAQDIVRTFTGEAA